MKVPVSSPHISNNPKPVSNSENTNTNNNNSSRLISIPFPVSTTAPQNPCYEPTSVLDPRRSPSPKARKPTSGTDTLDQWDDHVLQNLDWDSIMKELDFHDDSVPSVRNFHPLINTNTPDSQPLHNQNLQDFLVSPHVDPSLQFIHPDVSTDIYWNAIPAHNNLTSLELSPNWGTSNTNTLVGFDAVIHELIRVADCVDTNDLQLAHVILERLNQRLQSPLGKPLQRAAFYFREALFSVLSSSARSPTSRLSSWSDIVQTIRTYKAFSGISPIPMFTHFTTNQAILDSVDGSQPFIHIIDFDIGFGSHYASFMREFVEKSDSCKLATPVVRITAVVSEDYAVETKLIKECLSQYAQELKLRFQIDFVPHRTFEMLSFRALNFIEGEKTAVLLSPTIFRRLGSTTNATAFVNDLRRVSPSIVIFSDSESWVEPGATSFRRNFVNGLEFYSTMFESLDHAGTGNNGDWGRKIETYLMKPRILAAVEGFGRRVTASWRDIFCGAGMRGVRLSQFADFQAECLVGKMQMKGFFVAKRQAELVLCWHERPLIAVSAWKCQRGDY